ncbi:hypothetical protein [Rhodococcus sp. X156]|uniref:hypothetical protein n=1 Tax=Rhodococcus sp. X156 TaxID=2499145 RepID=UPI001F49B7EC|nr:hypothetical protein [Rhodococcus sp. X156]
MVVLWGEFPQEVAGGDRMTYVHGDHLVEWLRGQRAQLNAKQIAEIAAVLGPQQPPATAGRHRAGAVSEQR